jgi:hypothetical protein
VRMVLLPSPQRKMVKENQRPAGIKVCPPISLEVGGLF